MSPYLKFFWNAVNWMDRTTCKVKSYRFPHQRCTWCFIGAAVLLAVILVGSFFVWDHGGSARATQCYAQGSFDGVNVYLASPHNTMQSCASAAKGSGLTNLPSLPPGLQLVCEGQSGITVYMQPVQVATVRELGINPAAICS